MRIVLDDEQHRVAGLEAVAIVRRLPRPAARRRVDGAVDRVGRCAGPAARPARRPPTYRSGRYRVNVLPTPGVLRS